MRLENEMRNVAALPPPANSRARAMPVDSFPRPTDENRAPRGDPDTVMEEKWDQGEVDRMQSFGVPAVEPGLAPAQQRRTPSCELTARVRLLCS